jgi:hypothetical protein
MNLMYRFEIIFGVAAVLGAAIWLFQVLLIPDLLFRKIREQRLSAVMTAIKLLATSIEAKSTSATSAERNAIYAEVDDLLSLVTGWDAAIAGLWRRTLQPEESFPKIASRLRILERALETRRAALDRGKSEVADAGSGPPAEAPVAVKELPSPYESALLATLTEKFYGSWAFKGLAAALIAGVALAAGGTFLLGGQSYRLSDELEKKYNSGIEKFEKIQTTSQQAIQQQIQQQNESLKITNDAINTTRAGIQKQGDDFKALAKLASDELTKQQQNFSDTLKTSTVDRVVADLRNDLTSRTGTISTEMNKVALDLQKKLTDASDKVATIEAKLPALDRDVNDARTKLDGFGAKFGPLEIQVEAAKTQVEHIQRADEAAAQAKVQAEGYAATAGQAQRDAASYRDRVGGQLDAVANAIQPQQMALSEITSAISALRASLKQATDAVTQVNGTVIGVTQDAAQIKSIALISKELSELGEAVKALQESELDERLKKLESGKTLVSPPVPSDTNRREETLTDAERCAIQRQLKALGFQSGTIDGSLGKKSRAAIRRWQQDIGARDDGHLQSKQIDRLIGTGEAPPCSSRG